MRIRSRWMGLPVLLLVIAHVCFLGCSSPAVQNDVAANTETNGSPPPENPLAAEIAEEPPAEIDPTILDRLRTDKWTGDIDGLRERRYIRALVLYSKTGFFYDGPQPRGISYESLKEFERFINKKLNTGKQPLYVVFIPVTNQEGIDRMKSGRGDIAVANIPIIPELRNVVEYSDPVRDNAKEIVVTGPGSPAVNTLDDLAGKEVFARKASRYWRNLTSLNEKFAQSGKPRIILKEADPSLDDADILNMVASGAAGMTVMDGMIAKLWAGVYDGLILHEDITLGDIDQIGWVVQKGAPKFLALVNEFVKDHREGTSFGNTLLRRYQSTTWAKNNTGASEMEKFRGAISLFKKYGAEYEFDWLMIAAQAYQESTIDQSKVSPAGAYGVMQIKPSTAVGSPINIDEIISNMDNNIHAGVKYLDYIMRDHFKDAGFNKVNRALFAFAAYNAGPARVAGLRRKAKAQGLDENVWFNNVEIVAAKEIGPETVTYVSNIYKYYVAYKLVAGRKEGGT